MREVARHLLLAELEDDLLGAVDEVGDLALALLSEPHDLLARADEAAQGRHLLDDARVVLDVRRGGNERCELGHARLPARSFELGPLVELVGERDRVDRLALRPERERGAVDLRVALAVEVGRVEDLAHRADGDGREQHRAEHRLLGLEVLRRDDGAQALADPLELGVAHGVRRARWLATCPRVERTPHGGVKPSRAATSNGTDGSTRRLPVQGERNIRSDVIPAGGRPVDRRARVVQPETRAVCGNFVSVSTSLWRTVGTRYVEAPARTSGRRSRARPIAPDRRQVQAVLAEPRLAAAVGVPVGDDEAASFQRRCGTRVSARSYCGRSSRSSRAASPRSPSRTPAACSARMTRSTS